jgi:mRNA-degrading endonuclease toxin of MazEF toxin-antitoxin module
MSDGEELRHRVVIVSRNAINRRMKVIAADVTTTDRERVVPTAVLVEPSDENRLTESCYVNCHELATFVRGRLDAEPIGTLSPRDMWRVDEGLKIAFGFTDLPDR